MLARRDLIGAMTRSHTRHLYLTRHAEPGDLGSGLSDRGMRQAELLGRRLADVPIEALHHGPLPRAAETARVVADQLSDDVPPRELGAAGDYVPHLPEHDELDPEYAGTVLSFLGDVDPESAARGAAMAAEAIELLTGPVAGDTARHELVVTHAFTIGWLVRHALGAPRWRWWGQNHCHTGLTIIRYFPSGPPALVVLNDVTHLPADLRWTGFPAELRP
jgi:probable phosphoglycerate mutase